MSNRKSRGRIRWLLPLLAVALIALTLSLVLPRVTGAWQRRHLLALCDTAEHDSSVLTVAGTDRGTALVIAASLGAELSMPADGTVGKLYLPEGVSARQAIEGAPASALAYLSPDIALQSCEGTVGSTQPTDDTYFSIEEDLCYRLMGLGDSWGLTAGAVGGHRVKIAVIDSGIDYTHEDLVGRISELSYSVPAGKSVKEAGGDLSILAARGTAHGTKVASVIAAAAGNGVGVAGIAYDCELVFIRINDQLNGVDGSYSSNDMMRAMEYAASIGCEVVNLSLGAYIDIPGCGALISRLTHAGTLFVCAAGNDYSTAAHYPSSYDGVVSVGALSSYSNRATGVYQGLPVIAEYSNHGEGRVQLMAPGTWLVATDSLLASRNPTVCQTDIDARTKHYLGDGGAQDGWYNLVAGTSFAAPAVAASVGLYLSLYPQTTPQQMRQALCASATDLGDAGWDPLYGYGALNISALLSGQRATVTFHMGDATVEVEGTVGQTVPYAPPVSPIGQQVFLGWYRDAELTQPVDPYTMTLTGDVSLYASRGEEAESSPAFDYRAADPILAIADCMYAAGDTTSFPVRARTAVAICEAVPDLSELSSSYATVWGIISRLERLENATIADKTARAVTEGGYRCAVYGYYGKLCSPVLPATHAGRLVADIASGAFAGSTLSALGLSEGLLHIGEGAFAGAALEWLSLPQTVRSVGGAAFADTDTLVYVAAASASPGFTADRYRFGTVDETHNHDWLGGTGSVLYGAERFFHEGGEYLFQQGRLTLLTYAGTAARYAVTRLREHPLREVGEAAFADCATLVEVALPQTVDTVGARAFAGCRALTTLSLADGGDTLTLGEAAFDGCVSLASLVLPSSLVALPTAAFRGCVSLYAVTLSAGSRLSTVGAEAFRDCRALLQLNLMPCEQLVSVAADAFCGASALRLLALPDSLQTLGAGILRGATSLRWLELPFLGETAGDVNGASLGRLFAADPPATLKEIVLTGQSEVPPLAFMGLSGAQVWLSDDPTEPLFGDNTYIARTDWYAATLCYGGAPHLTYPVRRMAPTLTGTESLPMPIGTTLLGYDANGDGVRDGRIQLTADTTLQLLTATAYYYVRYLNYDGTLWQTSTPLTYGAVPAWPTLPDAQTATHLLHFTGWQQQPVRVTENITLAPAYTEQVRYYTVSYYSAATGALLTSQSYEYGAALVLPSYTQDGYRYDFVPQTDAPTAVTADLSLSGDYQTTPLSYTVTFVDHDGRLLASGQYAYGDTPIPPASPTREPQTTLTYTFSGFTPPLAAVTADTVYMATYTISARVYTVTFLEPDGAVIATQYYAYDDVLIPPTPTRQPDAVGSYRFLGWDATLPQTVRADATYRARYQIEYRQYTYRFLDSDGALLQEQSYHYGDTPTLPPTPTRQPDAVGSYQFLMWDVALPTTVTQDMTLTAVYRITYRMYHVRFLNCDGALLYETELRYGATPAYDGTPTYEDPRVGTYTFTAFSPTPTAVTGDATYTATYAIRYRAYTVTFLNADGTPLLTQTLHYGDMPTPPSAPVQEGDLATVYFFLGWDSDPVAVVADATYTAVYQSSPREYTVTFLDYDGAVLATERCPYGTRPTAPQPQRAPEGAYAYIFSGWHVPLTEVRGDVTYTACYRMQLRTVSVTFTDAEGSFTVSDQLLYGRLPQAPTPQREADEQYVYTFVGWDRALTAAVEDTVYYARYERTVRCYTVRFLDAAGEVLSEASLPYGTLPVAPQPPQREGSAQVSYVFRDWGRELVPVSADADYRARYDAQPRMYTISFYAADGRLLTTESCRYGTLPQAPEGERFSDLQPVMGDAAYYAVGRAPVWPAVLGGVAGSVILLGGAGWLLRRRRRHLG